jgi:hypothetical protein
MKIDMEGGQKIEQTDAQKCLHKGEMLFRRKGMARIEPVGSIFHLGIRVSRVAQRHNVKMGWSNGD